MNLKAPFPWFGGKSRVADLVWDRFGNVDNYVEPFAGSLAVLLSRPHEPQTETVNDIDCYLANFWRALSQDPEGLAHYADWPVNEADLHARHLWLVNNTAFRERMKTDPEFYDVQIAAWWVWGISQWIGSGWCCNPQWAGRTNAGRTARGVQALNHKRPMIHGGHTGKGVHAAQPGSTGIGAHRKMPHLGGGHSGQGRGITTARVAGPSRQIPSLRGDSGAAGQGIFSKSVNGKRLHLSGHGTGIGIHGDEASSGLYSYFDTLAARLRRVRVCCGDWKRVTGPSVTVKHGVCGIFLDPPYDMRIVSNSQSGRDGAAPSDGLYSSHDNELSAEVRQWAIKNGENPLLRIALCGYEGEHSIPDTWSCVPWKAHGGYGAQRGGKGNKNAGRERIWFSPHCLVPPTLWQADAQSTEPEAAATALPDFPTAAETGSSMTKTTQ